MKLKFIATILATSCFSFIHAQCITGCNDNTYLNSSDPNTIEYDNMISAFHASMIKEVDGTVRVWGQGTSSSGGDITVPKPVTVANGYNYTGTILKMAAASNSSSHQFALLTTNGLYIWGDTDVLVKNSAYTKNSVGFGKMATTAIGTNIYGLPNDVNPSDVKMMFGSYRTLAIVTCTGQAWILSFGGAKNGDGTTDNSESNANSTDVTWHRVSTESGTPLIGVVSMRGSANAMMVLTSKGDIYTWGTRTYLGDGVTGATNRTYATKMSLPTGISGTPKMIGMTIHRASGPTFYNTYYLLSTTGELWSLGYNNYGQLGDFSTTEKTNWVRVKKSPTENMDQVAWISPQEHDNYYSTISVLTTNGKLWSWGNNNGNMLGSGNGATNPKYMMGNLDSNDKLIALETGGHTTMVIRQCSKKYGYIGHRTNGSMGDGTSTGANETNFNFTNTAEVTLCGAPTNPVAITQNLKFCQGVVLANLADAILGSVVPTGMEIRWFTSINRAPGTEVTNPESVNIANSAGKSFYAFFLPTDGSNCGNPSPSEAITVSFYSPGQPGSENCYCTKPGNFSVAGVPTKVGITNQSKLESWPESVPNGFIALESKDKGLVITRINNATDITDPREGMLVYDITAKCVKLYNGTVWKCIERSCNN